MEWVLIIGKGLNQTEILKNGFIIRKGMRF